MKKLLIIGNGFDLSLGLKTSYKNFIESTEFQSLIGEDNSLCRFISDQFISSSDLQNTRWIDIENEIKNYIIQFQHENIKMNKIDDELYEIKSKLTEYLIKVDSNYIVDENSETFKFVKDYCGSGSTDIISFNYTSSIDKILLKIGLEQPTIDEMLTRVHNSLYDENIIFGIEEGFNCNSSQARSTKKTIQAGYLSNYKSYINSLLKTSTEVLIFGYSFGETDHFYFTEYFNSLSSRPISYGDFTTVQKIFFKTYSYVDETTNRKKSNETDIRIQIDIMTSSKTNNVMFNGFKFI